MSEVWMSSVLKGHTLVADPGFSYKYFDSDWAPAEGVKPLPSDKVYSAIMRHAKGEHLDREEMVEASYVYDMNKFEKMGDFSFAGGFFFVRGEFAKILSDMDLGGGELIPYTIYEADKEIPLEEKFFLFNFESKKESFQPHNSQKVEELLNLEQDGVELWVNNYASDDDITVGQSALDGADIWFEPKLHMMMFMSERLVEAARKAKVKPDLALVKCRVTETEG